MADLYTVDAVAWEEFVAEWNRYVAGDPKMPFVQIREGLAAVIDSARPAPTAAVPAERAAPDPEAPEYAHGYAEGWNACRAAMRFAAAPAGKTINIVQLRQQEPKVGDFFWNPELGELRRYDGRVWVLEQTL